MKSVAINGLGRIGRLILRSLISDSNYSVELINDLVNPEAIAYALKYDTIHGSLSNDITWDENFLYIDGKRIQVFSKKDPKDLPYTEIPIDYVIEASGRFTSIEDASRHIAAGARRVIITAPSDAKMFVVGVNHHEFSPKDHKVISCASCTTNCLAPIVKVLNTEFTIIEGLMTTVHAVTATQKTQDSYSMKDKRSGRGILNNIIPASTGAAKAVGSIIPELNGKLTGMAFRVPTQNVSVIDLVVKLEKPTTLLEIEELLTKASLNEMKGILGVTKELVVSADFNGCKLSSIYDVNASMALNDTFYKIVSWYDNEWGYANRVCDMMRYMTTKI